jgi:hypothetical protein
MSLALGLLSHVPASVTVACQIFVASPPAVGWHPHFGEPGYSFLQNSRQLYQQANDLAYCGIFSNGIDSDRVRAAWSPPPPPKPMGCLPRTVAEAGDCLTTAEQNFEQMRRFGIFHQNAATMPPEYVPPRGPIAVLPERTSPPLPRPRPPSERALVSALVAAEDREAISAASVRAVGTARAEECAPFFEMFFSLFGDAPRCPMFPRRDWY